MPEEQNSTSPRRAKYGHARSYALAFTALCSLYFTWAIFNNFNDILIKQFQKALALDRMQSGLVQSAFYFGYFSFALPAGYIIQRFGYKRGIMCGLLLAATGACLFWPAATIQQFWCFLLALYAIAAGLTFLETAVNPLTAVMGPPERSAFRLNLGQSFNGLGAFVAPTLGSALIFSGIEYSDADLSKMSPAAVTAWRTAEAQAVQLPYLALAGVLIVIAIAISRIDFPAVEDAGFDDPNTPSVRLREQRHFLLAVVAQFFYVGTQVGIWSYFINVAQDLTHVGERAAAYGLTLSLMLFMIGRFVGTALIRYFPATVMLALFGAAGALCCVLTMTLGGYEALVVYGATSFFMSICYPTIFALGVEGLGNKTKIAASYLVMAIIGGAVFPPIMGWIALETGKIQYAVILPLIGFLVVSAFGFGMYHTRRYSA